MDALNNLSNALSSIITIANMFLAGKKPAKNHPYDYGKVEGIHRLTRKITEEIYNKYGVILTIGIYASNIDNDEYLKN